MHLNFLGKSTMPLELTGSCFEGFHLLLLGQSSNEPKSLCIFASHLHEDCPDVACKGRNQINAGTAYFWNFTQKWAGNEKKVIIFGWGQIGCYVLSSLMRLYPHISWGWQSQLVLVNIAPEYLDPRKEWAEKRWKYSWKLSNWRISSHNVWKKKLGRHLVFILNLYWKLHRPLFFYHFTERRAYNEQMTQHSVYGNAFGLWQWEWSNHGALSFLIKVESWFFSAE